MGKLPSEVLSQIASDPNIRSALRVATLHKLGLRDNEIGDEGAKMLAGNITLNNLDLRDNEIGDEAKVELRNLVSKTGRTILF